jgi:hypothetical protein
MAATDFDKLFDTLKSGVVDLAKSTMKDYASQATKDGQNVLNKLKTDIEIWSKQVAIGNLSAEDLKFLIEGRKELTQMKALQQVGIAKIQLEKFQIGLTNLIINSILKVI